MLLFHNHRLCFYPKVSVTRLLQGNSSKFFLLFQVYCNYIDIPLLFYTHIEYISTCILSKFIPLKIHSPIIHILPLVLSGQYLLKYHGLPFPLFIPCMAWLYVICSFIKQTKYTASIFSPFFFL